MINKNYALYQKCDITEPRVTGSGSKMGSNDYIPYKQRKYIAIMRKNASACKNCEFRRP